ncbi:MAG: LysR family transcriptional regulator [Oscillospiraceae bacterium]
MNLAQLKYAAELERSKSISAAAKNLYMSQPNLSKSIRELEAELGVTLFQRSKRGVVPTKEGMEFLGNAKSILEQMENLENAYADKGQKHKEIFFAAPRASYIAAAYARWLQKHIHLLIFPSYKETNPVRAMQDVALGSAAVGIIRVSTYDEEYYKAQIAENGLYYETLWEFTAALLLGHNNPLAEEKQVEFHQLRDYVEIIFGDSVNPQYPLEHRKIQIYDRGSQFNILRAVPQSFMWVSPLPSEELLCHGLVVKSCRNAITYKDLIVYKSRERLGKEELEFINELHDEIAQLNMP